MISPPIPERDFDPTTLPPSSNTSSPTLAPSSPQHSPPMTPDHLRNNVVPLSPHPLLASTQSDTSAEDYLLPKALTASSVKPSPSLLRPLSGPRDLIAESIYILRPLVYGTFQTIVSIPNSYLLISSFASCCGQEISRSLQPRSYCSTVYGVCVAQPPSHSVSICCTGALRVCEKRQRYGLVPASWIDLGVIYQVCAKVEKRERFADRHPPQFRPKLESFVTRTSQAPLLGLFGALVKDWIPLIDTYYYCAYVFFVEHDTHSLLFIRYCTLTPYMPCCTFFTECCMLIVYLRHAL